MAVSIRPVVPWTFDRGRSAAQVGARNRIIRIRIVGRFVHHDASALMTLPLAIGSGALLLVVLVVGFRAVARHHPTPCPAWLAVLLENPYFETVAGSRMLLDRAHVRPGDVVLDVGCGAGRVTVSAARRVGVGGRVVALDLQEAMLRKLRRRIAEESVTNVELVLGDAGDGLVQSNTFDRALLVAVLGEIVNRQAALQEIFQALKPDGILSITEVLPDPHFQSRRIVRRLAEQAGFRSVERFGTWFTFTINFVKPETEIDGPVAPERPNAVRSV